MQDHTRDLARGLAGAVVVKFHGNYLGVVREALRRARAGGADAKLHEAKRIVWTTGYHLQRGEWRRFRPCEWMVPSRHQFRETWRESFLVRSRGHRSVPQRKLTESSTRPADGRFSRPLARSTSPAAV